MKFSFAACVGLTIHFICISSETYSQQTADSVLYRESLANIHQVYFRQIGDNAQIYHGREFIRNGQKANGYPFYESDNLMAGSVFYQGTIYPGQSVYYNLVSDELITNNYPHNAFIVLSSDKVDSFAIGHHVFVPLVSDKSNRLEKTGYYDQLYAGEPGLYAKREKRMVVGSGSEETKYIQHDDYFIKLKNVFYAVDGKSELLDVLKDQEDVLKKYIRANKLNFKKDLESSLVLTTAYYSQLKH
ncbi:MAG TPA: hypothetical protein VFI33_09885 [Puia sp.]|nr:hypothetical protein [Puia sp.]